MRHAILASLLIASAATGAQAQGLRIHAGAGVVGEIQSRGPHDYDDNAENGYTVFAGARWHHGFGVEAAYVDLGTISAVGITDAGFELDGELWSLGATYARRFDAVEPYAKLGWFTREEDGFGSGIAGRIPLELSDDGLMAEVGLRLFLGDSFALRAGYAHYDFATGGEGSVQLSAEYHF